MVNIFTDIDKFKYKLLSVLAQARSLDNVNFMILKCNIFQLIRVVFEILKDQINIILQIECNCAEVEKFSSEFWMF